MPVDANKYKEVGACPTRRERKTRAGASINAGKNTPALPDTSMLQWLARARPMGKLGRYGFEIPVLEVSDEKEDQLNVQLRCSHPRPTAWAIACALPSSCLEVVGDNMDLEMVTRANNSFRTYQSV
ncbi:unnamed protein product [Clonostachys byssicola]|uniref:Uncharacterized protein n=1 Tax=Clonostachys byssicola TaxID=160290 RepID=A0A9N9UT25_9HYPO|nr:unnamed protein product [Clonostachys byssicola]